jgi:hypothetical protein
MRLRSRQRARPSAHPAESLAGGQMPAAGVASDGHLGVERAFLAGEGLELRGEVFVATTFRMTPW